MNIFTAPESPSTFNKVYKKTRIWLLVLIGVLFPLTNPNNYTLHLVNISLMYAILTISLNILSGYTGLMCVGHIAFFGIGAYTAALLSTKVGAPLLLEFLAAGVIAALFGMLLGIPTLRLRGMYFSVATLAFGEVIYQVIRSWESFTNGSRGILKIPAIEIFGFSFKAYNRFYYLMLAALIIVIVLTHNLKNSRTGRAIMAIKANDIAAEAMGVNIRLYKLYAFMISTFFAGVAGAFYAHEMRCVSPDTFATPESSALLAMMVVGGIGSLPGAVLGGFVLTFLPEYLRFIGNWRLTLYGVAVVVIIIFAPKGLGGLVDRIDAWLSGEAPLISRKKRVKPDGGPDPEEGNSGEVAENE